MRIKAKIEKELRKKSGISIIELLDLIIEHANGLRASDIHIDPLQDKIRVRFRIDGILEDIYFAPINIHSQIISRIKILAGLRTDEHNAAQDGRFRKEKKNIRPLDIRVSIAPTYYGENAVLRLLANRAQEFTLDTLGFNENHKKKILEAISKPYGMILATGPTGSGKTTTLYTLMQLLNKKDVAIVTIEEPIEYAIEGVKQVQVNPRTGLTFANGLRSFLRQDPNIIMVGEIRDAETASLAVNTALTGHLLLSTLHTNDAATTLPRLLDMKVEPFLVASTVNIAIGQRLVRTICTECKASREMTDGEYQTLLRFSPAGVDRYQLLYFGQGCENCNQSGYRGRIGIYEILILDNDLREAILKKYSSDEIKKVAIRSGMATMVEDGLAKVKSGLTTIDEVIRVIHEK